MICITRIVDHRDRVIVPKKDDREREKSEEDVQIPGTSGAVRTTSVPTGAQLLGTYDAAETTPIPTGKLLPGTCGNRTGTVETEPVPTGDQAGKDEKGKENTPPSLHPLPPTQREADIDGVSLDEEEDDDKTVKMSSDSENEKETEIGKKGKGRPITTVKGVGIRQFREAKREAKKERDLGVKVKEALTNTVPKTKQWKVFLEREADLEEEFSHAPTLDLQAGILESTTQIFKAASCSLKMKGSLVHALKETTATTRAAMAILARRTKEKEMEEASGTSAREKFLVKQIEELKKKVERLEKQTSNPPESPTPDSLRRKAKRRKIVAGSDEEMDAPAPSTSQNTPPSLLQIVEKPCKRRKKEKALHAASGYCNGPPVGREAREAYPPWIGSQDREEFDSLVKQKTDLAVRKIAISEDPEKVAECVIILAQMNEITDKTRSR